jgi:hypothetical protein
MAARKRRIFSAEQCSGAVSHDILTIPDECSSPSQALRQSDSPAASPGDTMPE